MQGSKRSKYRVRFAETASDLMSAQALRFRRFRADREMADGEGIDHDAFDGSAMHVLVEDERDGRLVCCFRLMHFANGSEIFRSYSAQFYELSRLAAFDGPMLEMGRFCIEDGLRDPDILRVAWQAVAEYVETHGIELLFGCSSFRGVEITSYVDTFALLKDHHLAPKRWLPKVKASSVFRFARKLRLRRPDRNAGLRAMPPLLRTYLSLGGWVSDHAVIDSDLNTLHVFTGLEIRLVPPSRSRFFKPARSGV